MRRRVRRTLSASLAVVVVLGVTDASLALGGEPTPESRLVERGKSLYGIYCMSCHGATGAGDGSAAYRLRTTPPDLRQIAAENDGTFPFDRVYSTIAGFDEVHTDREMPLFGFAFQELDLDTDQQDEVRGRILQLIHFLRSIQQEAEEGSEPAADGEGAPE